MLDPKQLIDCSENPIGTNILLADILIKFIMFDNAKLHIYMNMISDTELILTDDKKIYHLNFLRIKLLMI